MEKEWVDATMNFEFEGIFQGHKGTNSTIFIVKFTSK